MYSRETKHSSKYLMTATIILGVFIISMPFFVFGNRSYIEDVNDYEILITYEPFENISIEAESAFVFDSKDDAALYKKNSNQKMPIASITKFMTILTAAEALPPRFPVVVYPESLNVYGESGLVPFEKWEFQELAAYTLIVSSNDGADAIARAAEDYFQKTEGISFIEKMNKKAKHIGMENSSFFNPTGLDQNSSRAGAYSTAEDVTTMVDYMARIHPTLVSDTQRETGIFTSISGYEHNALNTNQEIGHIDGLIASKTGFTDLAGGNLVVGVELSPERTIFITALGSGKDGRFSDVLTLYQESLKYFKYLEKRHRLEKDIDTIFSKVNI